MPAVGLMHSGTYSALQPGLSGSAAPTPTGSGHAGCSPLHWPGVFLLTSGPWQARQQERPLPLSLVYLKVSYPLGLGLGVTSSRKPLLTGKLVSYADCMLPESSALLHNTQHLGLWGLHLPHPSHSSFLAHARHRVDLSDEETRSKWFYSHMEFRINLCPGPCSWY